MGIISDKDINDIGKVISKTSELMEFRIEFLQQFESSYNECRKTTDETISDERLIL